MSVERKTENKTATARRNNTIQHLFTDIHTFFYRLSGGKLGGRFRKNTVLLLTTTGRKTGKQRTTPLIYRQDGDNLILVASNGGAPTHPTWWLNLQAKPEAKVEIGSKKMHVTARQANAEERARLWPLMVNTYGDYANYQKRTTREIPVVILQPKA
jgi:deazaflavin-dependent oxidoreductase (nitroreductase family)